MNAQDNAGHLTIAAAVFSALAAHDLNCAQRFAQSFQDQPEAPLGDQIMALNAYWRDQLGSLSISTVDVRACLVDHCEVQDWIRLFAAEVAPALCSLGLPQPARANAA